MRRRSTTPTWIIAQFDGTCKETGKAIKKGEEALYYPTSRTIYSADSQTAADWRSQQQADAYGLGDANW